MIKFAESVKEAKKILIIQAENPDGDSLGTAVALEHIFSDLGKTAWMYCATDMPKHIRYIKGWDRVTQEMPEDYDVAILVDNSSTSPMEKAIANFGKKFHEKPFFVLDHHQTESDIEFADEVIQDSSAVATSQVVFELAEENGWEISQAAGEAMVASILSDSLGLTSIKTTARTFEVVAALVKNGVVPSELDSRRKELIKKSIPLIKFKGQLLQRIEYFLDNKLAIIVINEGEIKQFSDEYNPSALVLEELRFTDEVQISVALKVYSNRITGALRGDKGMICDKVAESFGGGGHPFAAGFKTDVYKIEELKKELIKIVAEKLNK